MLIDSLDSAVTDKLVMDLEILHTPVQIFKTNYLIYSEI